MIRPEAREVLLEWREVILGVAFVIIGGNWLLRGAMLMPLLGVVFVLLGGAFIWLGLQRVRFPAGAGGPGIVEVTERQITYLTGQGGGAVAIDGLQRVELKSGRAGLAWVFTDEAGDMLVIPGDAQGAEALFDALVPLPGINRDEALRAAKAKEASGTYLIWQRNKRGLH